MQKGSSIKSLQPAGVARYVHLLVNRALQTVVCVCISHSFTCIVCLDLYRKMEDFFNRVKRKRNIKQSRQSSAIVLRLTCVQLAELAFLVVVYSDWSFYCLQMRHKERLHGTKQNADRREVIDENYDWSNFGK